MRNLPSMDGYVESIWKTGSPVNSYFGSIEVNCRTFTELAESPAGTRLEFIKYLLSII